jgi:hypothetical protein
LTRAGSFRLSYLLCTFVLNEEKLLVFRTHLAASLWRIQCMSSTEILLAESTAFTPLSSLRRGCWISGTFTAARGVLCARVSICTFVIQSELATSASRMHSFRSKMQPRPTTSKDCRIYNLALLSSSCGVFHHSPHVTLYCISTSFSVESILLSLPKGGSAVSAV